jgi:hypothetical protein
MRQLWWACCRSLATQSILAVPSKQSCARLLCKYDGVMLNSGSPCGGRVRLVYLGVLSGPALLRRRD